MTIKNITTALLAIFAPYALFMAVVNFATWGGFPFDMGQWEEKERVGYLLAHIGGSVSIYLLSLGAFKK